MLLFCDTVRFAKDISIGVTFITLNLRGWSSFESSLFEPNELQYNYWIKYVPVERITRLYFTSGSSEQPQRNRRGFQESF
uniref:Uncharacterized protein n=1 Tax=Tetraselmis sp. GSL018 TaxID=582737 RepID=A0A061SMI6_9CHLO